MKRGAPELDPELETLLQYRTVARHLPDDVRARVLTRSQAFVSGRRAISRVAPFAGPRRPLPRAPKLAVSVDWPSLRRSRSSRARPGRSPRFAVGRLTRRRQPFRRARARSPSPFARRPASTPSSRR